MAFEIRKAERRKAKARIGIAGVSGSGKTFSGLLIAYGIVGDWGKVGFIDTENGSGELYVGATSHGVTIGEYLYGRIEAPFTPQKYIQAIRALEQAGVEVIIIDSLSHAWAGEGGLLDVQGKEADRTGNSWSAWRKVTPVHNQLVEAMLQSRCHIIATMRAKTEYTQVEDERGKKQVKKLGLAPVQRDGMEYEFTVMFDIDINHVATASKDRTSLFDGQYITPSVATGQTLLKWLDTGADEPRITATEHHHDNHDTASNLQGASQPPIAPQKQAEEAKPADDCSHPNKNRQTEALTKAIYVAAGKVGLSHDQVHEFTREAFKMATLTSLYDLGKTKERYMELLGVLNKRAAEQG